VLLGAGEQWHAAPPVVTEAEAPAAPAVVALMPSPVAQRAAPPRAEALEPPEPAEEEVAEPPPPAAPAPNPQEAAFARGWDALRGAQPGIAAEAFHEAWGGAPEGPISEDAQFWESVALARAKRSAVAIAAMETFLERYPRSVRAGELSVMLGWLLLDTGSSDAARARFEAARADPNPAVREGARKGLSAVQGSSSSTRPP
jgi:TolA-binding protein